jgi:hypothetical protein
MKLLIDLIFIAILVVCAWAGYKKGIIMGIGGLLVIIISLYGGHLLSSTFSYEVIPALKPFASGYLESSLTKETYELLGYEADEDGNYDVDLSLHDMYEQNPEIMASAAANAYKDLGVYDSTAKELAEEAVETADENSENFSTAVVQVFCDHFTYYLGLLLGFVLIAIILTVVGNLLNIGFKFPALGILNDIGGTVLGLITGFCFCVILAWALSYLGKLLSQETLEATKVASWFLSKNYLAAYIG